MGVVIGAIGYRGHAAIAGVVDVYLMKKWQAEG